MTVLMQGSRGGVDGDPIGQRDPGSGLSTSGVGGGDRAQAAGSREPTVGPGARLDLPDTSVGFAPAVLDRDGGSLGVPAPVLVSPRNTA